MKQCPKCQNNCSEEAAFCPVCGEKTVDVPKETAVVATNENVRYCTKCGTPNHGNVSFCPKCGTPLAEGTSEEISLVAAPIDENPNEEHQWRFDYEKFSDGAFSLGAQYTIISAKGTKLSVEQSNRFLFFPYGKHFDQFDVKDIRTIVQEKKISITAILWIILGLLILVKSSSFLVAIAFIGLGIWSLRDTFVIIQHNRGGIRIRETKTFNSKREDFLNYVRRYNPNCIRMFVS